MDYALAATTFPTEGRYLMWVGTTDAVGHVTCDSNGSTSTARADRLLNGQRLDRPQLGLSDTLHAHLLRACRPASIIAGWDGAAPCNLVVYLTNNSSNDTLTIYDASDMTLLPLGTVSLRGNYVSGRRGYSAHRRRPRCSP